MLRRPLVPRRCAAFRLRRAHQRSFQHDAAKHSTQAKAQTSPLCPAFFSAARRLSSELPFFQGTPLFFLRGRRGACKYFQRAGFWCEPFRVSS